MHAGIWGDGKNELCDPVMGTTAGVELQCNLIGRKSSLGATTRQSQSTSTCLGHSSHCSLFFFFFFFLFVAKMLCWLEGRCGFPLARNRDTG